MTRLGALAALLVLLAGGPAEAKYASIVIEADTGRVLHAVNADTRNYPASLTKIMTLYMLFEALEQGRLRLDSALTVSPRAAGMPPSKIGVRAGRFITVEQAILALVTKSANDVAVVVAEALGGTEVKFARLMTDRARQLGMSRTTFRNASGLPNRGQLSTARDMALLGQRVMRDFPQYYGYFSNRSFSYAGRTHRNHNRLLSDYSGTDGIKTGYIRASGFNLVASVERHGNRLIGVVYGGRSAASRNAHMVSLLDKGFSRLNALVAMRPPPRPAIDGPEETLLAQGDADPGPDAVLAPPPPDARPALVAAPPGGWAVQVGAFSRTANARRAAEEAVRIVGADLIGARLVILPLDGRNGPLYRARLTGLEAGAAQRSCRVLVSRGRDCMAVAPRG